MSERTPRISAPDVSSFTAVLVAWAVGAKVPDLSDGSVTLVQRLSPDKFSESLDKQLTDSKTSSLRNKGAGRSSPGRHSWLVGKANI